MWGSGSIPSLAQCVKDPAVSCGVGRTCSSDPSLLWPAAAAPIGPLAWEVPYAMSVALKKAKKKKKNYWGPGYWMLCATAKIGNIKFRLTLLLVKNQYRNLGVWIASANDTLVRLYKRSCTIDINMNHSLSLSLFLLFILKIFKLTERWKEQ